MKLSKVERSQSWRLFWKKLCVESGEVMVSPLNNYHHGTLTVPFYAQSKLFLHRAAQRCQCVQRSTAQRMDVCWKHLWNINYKNTIQAACGPDEELSRKIKLSWTIFTPVQKHNDWTGNWQCNSIFWSIFWAICHFLTACAVSMNCTTLNTNTLNWTDKNEFCLTKLENKKKAGKQHEMFSWGSVTQLQCKYFPFPTDRKGKLWWD